MSNDIYSMNWSICHWTYTLQDYKLSNILLNITRSDTL